MSINESRLALRHFLSDDDPADAPTAYYALHHPPGRTALVLEHGEAGQVVGFVARCQTGIDLFRPLVTVRCESPRVFERLAAQVLTPGRAYIFFARRDQFSLIQQVMRVEQARVMHLYRLDPKQFKPVVNVMVQHQTSPDGAPRCEIYSGGLQAVAGVNWRSRHFAELFVHTEEEARRRGWGRSVVAACTEALLKAGQTPLYLVEPDKEASRAVARGVGYVDTGARQVYAEVVYVGEDEGV